MSQSIPTTASLEARGEQTRPTNLRKSFVQLQRRRLFVLALNGITYVALVAAVAYVLSFGDWTVVDSVMLAAFAVGAPWTVVGFWNAVIGLSLLHGTRDPVHAVAPFAAAGDIPSPVTTTTAVLMTLRNEDPERALARLAIVKDSLDQTGYGAQFSYFILSDTDHPGVAAAEEAAVAAWRRSVGDFDGARIIYRRREINEGFKAGNVRDFCVRWGGNYDFMLPLDADSLMSGDAILRLVRIMQTHRRIGILQTLVVGLPSQSAFARVFQFGMRHGMRPYTMGQAWWTGDCGPFWGHNALVRIKPFTRSCHLEPLPGKAPFGGPILSHDQVEATFMRRAGYEVRVIPVEDGSWEENPPTIVDFMQRDTRWCQGNLQYIKLLDTPGLKPLSRVQLAWAILMFVGIPAWTLMIALLPFAAIEAQAASVFPVGLAAGLYAGFMAMYLSPKLAGFLDVALTRGGVARYGGAVRFTLGAVVELVFSFLQGAISTIRTTLFMVGLLFGKKINWGGQARDAHGLSLASAARELWPQTMFGLIVCSALYSISPVLLLWSLPLTAGYVLAIPFACLTASPSLGRVFSRHGVCAIPEDVSPPPEVRALSRA